MDSFDLNEIYKFLLEAVPKCGRIIYNAYHESKAFKTKCSFADIVTETDEHVEKLLFGLVKEKYPNHRFIGEESTNQKVIINDDPIWILDPVDGTCNFVHKFPYCSISIAFFLNKKPQVAVVFNPITNELFSAIRGQGAYLNGQTLIPSKQTELNKCLVITELGSARDPQKMKTVLHNIENVINAVHGIRCLGSAALNMSYVANGSADVYYEFGIHCWDIAAGILIAEEAGCVVYDFNDDELDICKRRVLCASTRELATQIAPLIQNIEFEND